MGILEHFGLGSDREYARAEAAERARPTASYLVGLDLGQRDDYTALAVLEDDRRKDTLTLRRLERVRGKPYTTIARMVGDVMVELGRQADTTLLVDVTGVGAGIADQLDAAEVAHTRISIHGGDAVNRQPGGGYSVPKRDLVAELVLAFEQHTLHIPRDLRHGATLEREALAFQMKLSPSGHDTYNARSGEHDDLLLAVSMPVWFRKEGRLEFFFA
jgi:hypothetical protein